MKFCNGFRELKKYKMTLWCPNCRKAVIAYWFSFHFMPCYQFDCCNSILFGEYAEC